MGVYRENEPEMGATASHFHTHERVPAFADGAHDAHVSVQRAGGSKQAVLSLLDVAWSEWNSAHLTSAAFDYWHGHVTTYRDVLGLSVERDHARRSA